MLLLALLQTPTPPVDPAVAIDLHVRAGRYLAALDGAERRALVSEDELVLDQLGLLQSFVGLEEEMLVTFDRMTGETAGAAGTSPVDAATALDALPALVEAAKGRRIVVLNESHHFPRHRAFALELARALRAEGFDTFAAETFADAPGTQERGWPDASTGYYTAEPVFGELVRGVTGLGYRLVAYEWVPTGPPTGDVGTQIRVRETVQAKNLHERVFQANPEARLFVYVGYSHATEDWTDPGSPNERAWMAARLAKLTGFDPLTIDQTECGPRSEPAFENAHWRRAEERGLLDGPRLLRPANGEGFVVVGSWAGKVDAQVFHPRTPPVHGRPGWLARGRSPVQVPAELATKIPSDERVLLQAFHAGEGSGAIPADQFAIEGGALPPWFLLAPGTYRLALQDVDGKTLATLDGVRVE